MAEELNRRLSKEEMQTANKYMMMLNVANYQGNADQNHSETLQVAVK